MTEAALTLIAYDRQLDQYGVQKPGTLIRREIFAQVESVGRNEYFAAGQNGIRADYRFRVFAAEYLPGQFDQRECEYNGERYVIYRTYQPDAYARHNNYSTKEGSVTRSSYVSDADRVELYAGKRVGVNGA